MKYIFLLCCALSIIGCIDQTESTMDDNQLIVTKDRKTAIAIHGGAGNLKKKNFSPEQELEYKHAMELALQAGQSVLNNGGASDEAVVATISILENSPLFNAGKGAVFANDGLIYLDASIMEGKNRNAGAIAAAKGIKNPILAAQLVLLNSKHVLLSGEGAEKFAEEHNLPPMKQAYFFTQARWDQYEKALAKDTIELDHDSNDSSDDEEKLGTVGCVALDKYGNLAAGTSTGGLTNKKYGRIGDSPLIGAGTYAHNKTCAVSCTGRGEEFIRIGAALQISLRMELQGQSLKAAIDSTLFGELKPIGGRGGCVAIDSKGKVEFGMTTSGMFRGYVDEDGNVITAIYSETSD